MGFNSAFEGLISTELPSLYIQYEAEWDPEPVWKFTTKDLFPYWESNHDSSVLQLVT
jgi:hypothetical protein